MATEHRSSPAPAASTAAHIGGVLSRFRRHAHAAAEAVNLVPSENQLSPLARLPLRSDFYNRYFFNDALDPDFWQFRGGQEVAELEIDLAIHNLSHLSGAPHVNVRPISGMSAMMIAMAGLAGEPGGTVVSIAAASGGHYATEDVARRLGFHSRSVPVTRGGVDPDSLSRILREDQPELVYLDFQNCRYELDIAGVVGLIKEFSPNTLLHVDCSHTLGLVLGGAMANPLLLGADSMGGSTHKTFPGPHKGILMTRSDHIRGRLRDAQFRMLSSHHFAETMALGFAAAEFAHFGAAYARQVITNAQSFGNRLRDAGFDVVADDGHITETHQLWARIGDADATSAFSQRLFEQGIRVNVQVDLPGVPGPALRLGLNELTFLGGGAEALAVLADEFVGARSGHTADGKGAQRVREAFGSPYYFTELG
ncbi:glycine hydroxymethyltransferase [Streptomyces sp. Ncost-T6T-1]|uniref:hypothetical protein n=1 Tax=Streptomyces sp. Ncost-T6T-1 TaxID=1100828 RepID=UPI000805F38E|nr:hypothetical protein [Streptomyces sp. Ncost-T6T-1]SBU94077.1 glycine hydroxymethyltransferase [Streptomyces sp. Ncost-T6T-1]